MATLSTLTVNGTPAEITVKGEPNIKYTVQLIGMTRKDDKSLDVKVRLKAYFTNIGAYMYKGYGLQAKFSITDGTQTASMDKPIPFKTYNDVWSKATSSNLTKPKTTKDFTITIGTKHSQLLKEKATLTLQLQVTQTSGSLSGSAGCIKSTNIAQITTPSFNYKPNEDGKFISLTQTYNNTFVSTIKTPKVGTNNSIKELTVEYKTNDSKVLDTYKNLPTNTTQEIKIEIPEDLRDKEQINITGQMTWKNVKENTTSQVSMTNTTINIYTKTKIDGLTLVSNGNHNYTLSGKIIPGKNLTLSKYKIIINNDEQNSYEKIIDNNYSNSSYDFSETFNYQNSFQLNFIVFSNIKNKLPDTIKPPEDLTTVSENISTEAIPLYFYNNNNGNKEETQVEQIIFYDEDSKQIEIDQVYYFDSNGNKTLVFQKKQKEA